MTNNLSAAQADGLACTVCSADYLRVCVPHVPVGRSETGSQVFACKGACALRAKHLDSTAAFLASIEADVQALANGDAETAQDLRVAAWAALGDAPLSGDLGAWAHGVMVSELQAA